MILIRADANAHIGAGHVMRCISVANELIKKGQEVLFVTSDQSGAELIKQYNFSCICLNSNWANMENEGIEHVVKKMHPNLVLIDSYQVTKNYLSGIRKLTKTAYFDDLNICQWDVDYLINYNIIASLFDYSWHAKTRTKLLLHPQYAPLREEFCNRTKKIIKPVTEVMVSAGGADPECITEKILSEICLTIPNISFHFVVGALNPRLEKIRNIAHQINNAVLHINEQNISELMNRCDIAISAAGITLYELCAMGVPTIVYSLADNQKLAAYSFGQQGVMLSAGDCRENEDFIDKIKQLLIKLINNKDKRIDLSKKMQKLVDGNGASRIADELSSIREN